MHDARLPRFLFTLLPALVLIALARWMSPVASAAPPALPAETIQHQIETAPDGGSILVGPGTHYESVTINKNLTVTAVSSATIIQAVGGQRAITVTPGHTVTLQNLTIQGGSTPGGVGGGILMGESGDLRIVNCRITGNSALYGGGIFADGTANRVDVSGSIFEGNTAALHGGALWVRGTLVMTATQVLSNTAGNHGGGAHVQDGRADLNGGLFAANEASGGNGGALNVNNSVTVSGTQFISNAALSGGALLQWNAGQTAVVSGARFERNQADLEGGALWARANLTVTNAHFISNTAIAPGASDAHGGGIYLSTGALAIISSTFTGNRANCTGCFFTGGGGAYATMAAAAAVQGSRFEDNYGWTGGAIETSGPFLLAIQQSAFMDNSGGYGGALHIVNANIGQTTFSGNQAVNVAGAIQGDLYALQGMITLSRVQFISNTASLAGGGALSTIGTLDAQNVLFAGNRSMIGGAALQLDQLAAVTLRHVTIAQPQDRPGAAIKVISGTLSLTNTAIVSHAVGISMTGGTVNADYNLISVGTVAQYGGGFLNLGAHNLYALDPRFVNPAAADYRLRAGSPAIGAGINAGVALDLDGRSRLNRFDIGAYQYWARLFLPALAR